MGVVTVSSSPGRTPLGLSKSVTRKSTSKRPLVVAFKVDKSYDTALAAPQDPNLLPLEVPKDRRKKDRKVKSSVKDVSCDDVQQSSLELDYNEAAAKLESIFKLSPATEMSDVSDVDEAVGRGRSRRKTRSSPGKVDRFLKQTVVRNRYKKVKRLSLDRRIALRKKKEEHVVHSLRKQIDRDTESEKIDRLVRDYSGSTDLVSLNWKTMKIPPVLHSTEHTWLFKLMQPMKALLEVKDQLQKKLDRDPTEGEIAEAMNMNPAEVRKQLEVGRAARNKIIKHNLRLVLFVINKYFQDFANGPGFQDLCQAGVKGLITSVDRFEPKRRCRLSTYAFFWIRHAIIRSMTVSSFTRVPFGLESIRVPIQRAKLELMFELHREPTVEEIVKKVGISPERYEEVMKASRPIGSLNARHAVSQEEFINRITDVDGAGGVSRRQPALLRLALDDALDSLIPKESLVIRQRYGLDGNGDRTLREIAGNLDMSIETVRKHEVKALMKLKHPTRADYLRRYVV